MNLVKSRSLRDNLSVLRDLLFEKGASDVNHVCSHHTLDVKAQNVTGHFREHNVNINVQAIIVMRNIHQHIAFSLISHESSDLCHT